MSRIFNFSAGPAMMPESVLRRAADEMLDYQGSGMSVMEMSHRSKQYDQIINDVEAKLRRVMGIPDTHKPLFLQGGATLQFSTVPGNLMSRTGKADYAVTGYFAKKAFADGKRYGDAVAAVDTSDIHFTAIPEKDSFSVRPDAAYFHYCMNNTIYGTRWHYIPEAGNVPLVSDISSCILSEPLDVSKFGVLYAGAQKNLGPAGLTLVIVREDLAVENKALPGVLSYRSQIDNNSMLNTPPTYSIYLLGLVLDWIEENGGVVAMGKRNADKAQLLYDVIDSSNGFYKSGPDKASRSIMNVVFTTGDNEKDAAFIKGAAAEGMSTLKGHRAVGGMRASIYNAMPVEGVEKLAQYMKDFK